MEVLASVARFVSAFNVFTDMKRETAMNAAAEALEDSVDTPMVDPMTDEELGEDFPTLPEATSGSIASGNGKKSLQTLPEVTSTAREAMSGKSEAMSGVTRGNVWNSKGGVHLADSTSLP